MPPTASRSPVVMRPARRTDSETVRRTGRQTDGQAGRQTGRQAGRQAHGHAGKGRPTDRDQRERETCGRAVVEQLVVAVWNAGPKI